MAIVATHQQSHPHAAQTPSSNASTTPSSNGGGGGSRRPAGPRGYTGPLTVDGKPNGLGRQEYRDGSIYVGPFVNGIRDGPGGQFIFSNGDTYVGQFQHGDKHGRGEYRWCDGSSYNGRWEHDKRCGDNEELTIAPLAGAALRDHFIFSFYSRFPRVADLLETLLGSELQYRGGFLDDAVHGNGEMIFTCGANFEGSFEHGMEHGHCILHVAPGVRIEGEWYEGEVQTLVHVFCDRLFPHGGKAASILSDLDVKEILSIVYESRGMYGHDNNNNNNNNNLPSPQRFGDTFTKTRQLAAQAAAEGVFGRPARDNDDDDGFDENDPAYQQQQNTNTGPFHQNQNTQTSFDSNRGGGNNNNMGSGGASSHPISRASRANLQDAVSRMGTNFVNSPNHHENSSSSYINSHSPVSRGGQQQLHDGVMGMKHPVPISRAGKDGLDRAVARMGDNSSWSVGGGLVEWVEPIGTDHKNVTPNAWWRTYESRNRRRMGMQNYGPGGEYNGHDNHNNNNTSMVTWNSVGNNNHQSPHRQQQQNDYEEDHHNHHSSLKKKKHQSADAEIDALMNDPNNHEEMMMLKDMPTRADVIQRIIDSAASKRKLVRCGIAVSLADCEVCSAFTNRVWWYLRLQMKDPSLKDDQTAGDIPPDARRIVRVLDVAPGGVGEQWGLTRGDAVVSYCGYPAWEQTVLRKKSVKPGDQVTITVVRRTFDGDVEHAGAFQPTNEPPTRLEEFASTERVIEKTATVGCNITREDWELLKTIPTSVKSSVSWMQDANWADLRSLLKKVRGIQVSSRPEAWLVSNKKKKTRSSSSKKKEGQQDNNDEDHE